MGHPETLNQMSMNVRSLKEDHTKTPVDSNGHDVPRFIDLSSKGISIFPNPDSYSSLHRVTSLYLNDNKLTTVPCGLHALIPNLQVLRVDGNDISKLPADICELQFLQELSISKNKLISLPKSLYKLKRLQILKASQNRLKCLHSEIGQNECLEILDISENVLKRFPATLGLLKNLRVIEASKNIVDYIPQTVHFLKSLQVVNLSCNKLTAIPDSFSLLENLIHVNLSENQISHLWPSCASTHCLENIILDSNSLTVLPSWFSQLDNVQEISAARNNLGHRDSFPSDFGARLQRLSKLDLRGNCIENLGPTFSCLSGLQTLLLGTTFKPSVGEDTFHYGNWLTALPNSFTNLKHLVFLAAEDNQLTDLPKDFGSLVLLKKLCLGGNLLTSLPKSFCQLASLEKCWLSRNALKSLPVEFGHLDKLKELYLDSNKLKTVPLSMKNCVQLEVLDLRGNRLAEVPPGILSALSKLKEVRLLQPLQDDENPENEFSSANYSEDEEEDYDENVAKDSRSTSSGSSCHCLVPVKDDEENWDDDIDVPTSETEAGSKDDASEFERGQFDLDGEKSCWHSLTSLTFDFYGNASQRIDLSISQHRMLPYLLHQPKQTRWQRETYQQEEEQYDDAVDVGT